MKRILSTLAILLLAGQAFAGNYIGDYAVGDTIDCNFGTVRPSTGASFTLAGTPAVAAYVDNSTTEITAGITLTADFDSRTGMNHVRVVASGGNGYSAGTFVSLVITAGTVDSVSVVGQEVCSFTLGKVSALRPTTAARTLDVSAGGEAGIDWANIGSPTTTVNLSGTSTKALEPTTLGRTLDVTATGEAGIDWANIGSPSTSVNLSGTTISTSQAVASVSGAVGSVTGAVGSVTGNVGGNVTGSVGSIASGGITEASFATTAGSFKPLGIIDQGTAQAATATTVQLRSAASFGDDTVLGATIVVCGSTQGYCQAGIITDYVGSTDTATVATWGVTPSGTITYYLFGTAPASGGGGSLTAADVWTYGTRTLTAATNITSSGGTIPITSSRVDASVGAYQTGLTPLQPTTSGRTLDVTATGEAGIDWANIGSPTTSVNLSGTTISTSQAVASVSGAVGSVTGAVGSVTGNVGGNVTGSVGSVASGGITASSFAADAITAAKVASDVGAEFADATWDEARTGHTTAGTFGFYLDSSISGVSTGGVSADAIADAVWDEDMTAHQTQGTSGQVLGDSTSTATSIWSLANTNLNATVSSRAAQTTADSISAAIAALNDLSTTDIRDIVIEDQGSTISLGCALAAIVAYAGGDVTTSGATSTYKDPSGGETRITGTVSSGSRAATITCPTQ